MRDHVTEDRISAYLDGELNLDERLLVEQQLAESEDLRNLFEDLRRVRSQLQSLPKFQLPNDFASRVVQQIQQTAVSPAAVVKPTPRRQQNHWRSAAATLASIAVVVVIAFSLPHGPKPPVPGTDGVGSRPVVTPVFLQRPPQYLLVYDVTVTPGGAEANRFADVLNKAGVGFDPHMKLDGKLESDLIALQETGLPFPNDSSPVPFKDSQNLTIVPERVEMVYLTGRGKTIDTVGKELLRLAELRTEIRQMHLQMVFEPKQIAVLKRLHDSARLRFAQSGGVGNSSLGVAFGLEFNIHLTSVNVPEVATFAMPSLGIQLASADSSDSSTTSNVAEPSDLSPAGSEDLKTSIKVAPEAGASAGDNAPAAVLVILRYPAM